MKILEKTMYLVVIVLLITIGALGWLLKQKTETIVERDNQIVFLTDTLEVTTNAKGQAVGKIARLEASSAKSFLEIKNLKGINRQLQDVVDRNKDRLGSTGSVSIIGSTTKINETVATTKVTPKESEFRPDTSSLLGKKVDTIYVYPEYQAVVNLGRWINAKITANRDSSTLAANIVNEYELVLGEDPIKGTGFLGIGRKYQPFSEVTNLNPYSKDPVVKTFSIKNNIKPKRLGIGLIGGYGFGFKVQQTDFFIGAGLSFKIL